MRSIDEGERAAGSPAHLLTTFRVCEEQSERNFFSFYPPAPSQEGKNLKGVGKLRNLPVVNILGFDLNRAQKLVKS